MVTTNSRLRIGSVSAPEAGVSVYEAIHSRRMNNDFADVVPGRDALQRMSDAAAWESNHRLTNPWRFFVLEKGERNGRRWRSWRTKTSSPMPASRKTPTAAFSECYAPALIYVYSVPGDSAEMTQENYAAACCAVANLLLAVVAESLAEDWSTGD